MVARARILIPGGAGYIGSHVVLCVLLTRRYKVTGEFLTCSGWKGFLLTQSDPLEVMDTFANSFPEAIKRVEQIALNELPKDASQEDRDACKIDLVQGDMRERSAFKDIFNKYKGDDAIYAVILVAALKAVGESGEIPIECVCLFIEQVGLKLICLLFFWTATTMSMLLASSIFWQR